MSIFVIRNSHELHQLKKALLLLRESMTILSEVQLIADDIGIISNGILASIWNIPLCLWFTKKVGVFATLILNVGMSFMLGTLGANTSFWFICPYSWVTRLMVPTLGILPNGESVTGSALSTPLPLVIMTICLSLLLLYTISKSTAKSFIKQEVL